MNVIVEHLREREPTLVIWLAYSEELCEQAASEFEQAWRHLGNRELQVYRYWGKHQLNPLSLHDGFLVAGLSKLYQSTMKDLQILNNLAQKCSLVIIDEAHQATAATYSLLLDSLVVQRRTTGLLGLSATPGRTWANIDADQALSDFFARRKVMLNVEGYENPIEYLVAEQYLAKAEYKTLMYHSGVELSPADIKRLREVLDIPEEILIRLGDDEQRNLVILAEIERLAREHQRILVFAPSVPNSNLLASVLQARGLTAYSLTGGTPSIERERLIREFKGDTPRPIVLCNYGVLTTGFDAPRTSAAVIARPTRSLVLYSQMVGRALRGVKAGGNPTAEIVTVVDPSLYGFGSAAEAFKNWEDVWE
jgi:superfamily II DNA or RNA helicase